MNKQFSIIITTLLLFSCSEKPAGTGPSGLGSGTLQQSGPAPGEQYVLELTPKEATRKSTLSLHSTGFDLSNAKIEWFVNDRPYTTVVPTQFIGADAVKGRAVQAKASFGEHEVKSNIVQMINSLPEITRVKILPEVFKPGDALSVEVIGSDADGDAVTFSYEWTRNGETAGKGERIESPIKRGDNIVVKITPFDGEGHGNPVVIQRDIRNLPPLIVDHKEFNFDGTVYTYQVKASDPDGDKLSYSLESPESGMTIDASTGSLRWIVPGEFKGKKDVSIIVSDANGGTAQYRITITIL